MWGLPCPLQTHVGFVRTNFNLKDVVESELVGNAPPHCLGEGCERPRSCTIEFARLSVFVVMSWRELCGVDFTWGENVILRLLVGIKLHCFFLASVGVLGALLLPFLVNPRSEATKSTHFGKKKSRTLCTVLLRLLQCLRCCGMFLMHTIELAFIHSYPVQINRKKTHHRIMV